MNERTSWDAPETEGVKAYRRRRREKGVDTDRARDIAAESVSEVAPSTRLGITTAESPADQTVRQEKHFSATLGRDAKRRRQRIISGGAKFNTDDAAAALRNRGGY